MKKNLFFVKDSLEPQKIKFKCMTLRSKIFSIDKLNDTANKYNNTYHSTIKKKTC